MEILYIVAIIQAFCVCTSEQAIPKNHTLEEGGDKIDGDAVIDVGKSLKDPLVKLIGTAIKNLQDEMKTELKKTNCRIQSCLEWSDWTECIHEIDNYGIRNRTRLCGQIQDGERCAAPLGKAGNTTENESRLCEIHCPVSYTKTEHGFCVKLIKVVADWYEAQSHCENDGANLINIDSKQKSQDLKIFTLTNTYVWIDGIRKSRGADWEVKSGKSGTFSNWATGQPSSDRFPACRVAIKYDATKEWIWKDSNTCINYRMYICEIEQ